MLHFHYENPAVTLSSAVSYKLWDRVEREGGLGEEGAELRSCVKVQVAVPGSPSLISLMVSVDVKQH